MVMRVKSREKSYMHKYVFMTSVSYGWSRESDMVMPIDVWQALCSSETSVVRTRSYTMGTRKLWCSCMKNPTLPWTKPYLWKSLECTSVAYMQCVTAISKLYHETLRLNLLALLSIKLLRNWGSFKLKLRNLLRNQASGCIADWVPISYQIR
jgi:hypothetical protein